MNWGTSMKRLLVVLITTVALGTIGNQVRAEVTEADRSAQLVLEAMQRHNSDISDNTDQSRFILAYASTMHGPLRGFDRFVAALSQPNGPICNFLCESKVTKGFWIDAPVSSMDIVRYVLTSTCYGFLNRGEALKLFDQTLPNLAEKANRAFLSSDKERYTVKVTFGDLAKTENSGFPRSTELRRLAKLWKAASGGPRINLRSGPELGPVMDAAARAACRNAPQLIQ
jgi:hypothetical protein